MRILLVEDDALLGQATADGLSIGGARVDWARDCMDARVATRMHEYDTIVLDLGLPDLPGEGLLRQLRSERCDVPIIVITARGLVEDRVSMLDQGADDYLVKPFDLDDLKARVRAVVRRTVGIDVALEVQIHGPLELFQRSRTARWNGHQVALTTKEYDLLEALVMRRTRIQSRAQLERLLYERGDEIESNAIEVYVHYLRRKFTPELIVTVRGKGYQIGSEDSLRINSSV